MRSKLAVGAIIATLIITVNLWIMGTSNFSVYINNPLIGFSKLAAFVGTVLLCYEFILASRLRFLEDIFDGQDDVYRIHHIVGGLAFVAILQHPLFLVLHALPNTSLALDYLIPNDRFDVTFGISALYIMLILLVFTLFIKVPYEYWKGSHMFMSIPLFLISLHVFFVNGIARNYLPLKIWLFGFMLLAALSFVYKRFIYPYSVNAYRYELTNVKQFDQNHFELWLKPLGRQIERAAGQYVFVRFESEAVPSHEHAFGIANYDDSGHVRLGIKNLGDFTSQIPKLKIGDKAKLIGPHGKFSRPYHENVNGNRDMIWIAGGIGVTPFLAMLDHAVANNFPSKLHFYYATVTLAEKHFEAEIVQKGSSLPGFVYSDFPEETKGFLTAKKLVEDTGEDIQSKLIFVCGPPGMMNALKGQLLALGVPEQQIVMEDFSFI